MVFAFIDDVIYDNDGTAGIRYTVDEFSTWFDYWECRTMFCWKRTCIDDTGYIQPEGWIWRIIFNSGIASTLNIHLFV